MVRGAGAHVKRAVVSVVLSLKAKKFNALLGLAVRHAISGGVAYSAKKPKRPRDTNQLAKLIAGIATGEARETSRQRQNPSDKGNHKKDAAKLKKLPLPNSW
jgi:hypothetical protein